MIEIGSELRRTLRIAELAKQTRAASLATKLEELHANGYVVFERVVSDEQIEQVSEELEPWFEATPRCRGDFYGWNTTRFGSVLVKSPAAQALASHDLMLSMMHEVLGPHCDWFQLNLSQAERIHPGERQQVPHRDDQMWPCAKNGVEFSVSVMWALSDFTMENGATLLWPRTHFAALDRQVDPVRAISAEMPRGSALVYLGSITHCSGANRTSASRTGLVFSYCLGWLKQCENAFLAYPPAVAKQFPASIRDLLGYRIHRPNLGGYESQDPAVLFETSSRSLAAIDAVSPTTALELHEYYHGRGAQRSP